MSAGGKVDLWGGRGQLGRALLVRVDGRTLLTSGSSSSLVLDEPPPFILRHHGCISPLPSRAPRKRENPLLHHLPHGRTKVIHPILLDLVLILLILEVGVRRILILIVDEPSASFLAFAEFLSGRPEEVSCRLKAGQGS